MFRGECFRKNFFLQSCPSSIFSQKQWVKKLKWLIITGKLFIVLLFWGKKQFLKHIDTGITNKLRFAHYRVEVTNFEGADSSSSGVSENESEEILAYSGKIYL